MRFKINCDQSFPADRVDFTRVSAFKSELVRRAWDAYSSQQHPLRIEFEKYCETEQAWLHDYALFMAIRAAFGQVALHDWPTDVRKREPVAIAAIEKQRQTCTDNRAVAMLDDRTRFRSLQRDRWIDDQRAAEALLR